MHGVVSLWNMGSNKFSVAPILLGRHGDSRFYKSIGESVARLFEIKPGTLTSDLPKANPRKGCR